MEELREFLKEITPTIYTLQEIAYITGIPKHTYNRVLYQNKN